jgi:hypothetical protein
MALASPLNFNAQQGNNNAYLSWDAVIGATLYDVYRSTNNVSFTLVATIAAADYLDTSVVPQTQYWYYVIAKNGTDQSQATETLNVIPVNTSELSLGEVRLRAQQKADRVNSNFVSLTEWNFYINQSYKELYDLLVTLYEDYYVAEPYVFITNGDSKFLLPNGSLIGTDNVQTKPFYKLLGVDCGLGANNNAWVTLNKFEFISRNKYVYPNISSTFYGVFNMQYRVMGNYLQFIPTPSAAQFIRVWYIPRLADLLKDTDALDGVSGWTEYVIVDAAIKALQKEESDVSVLMAEKQMLIDRIEAAGMNRDAGQPSTISDTRSWSTRNGGGGGWNGPTGGV